MMESIAIRSFLGCGCGKSGDVFHRREEIIGTVKGHPHQEAGYFSSFIRMRARDGMGYGRT